VIRNAKNANADPSQRRRILIFFRKPRAGQIRFRSSTFSASGIDFSGCNIPQNNEKMLCISALLALVGSCFAEPVRIVAYGDSLTYGWIPNANPPSTRYGLEDRWPGALQKELGNNYQVIEEGLDGRTTDARDPGSPISGAQLDGSAYLPACLASHLPVDLVIIMLGTNDLKPVLNRTPLRIAIGAAHLIDLVTP
jgi:lysophospholipase L1-like esterase